MASLFSRFRRGRRGRGRGRGSRKERSGRDKRRDSHSETDYLETRRPPPPAPQPGSGYRSAPAPVQPPPVRPGHPPSEPSSEPSPGREQETQYHKIGGSSSGVVAVLIGIEGKLKDEVYKVLDGENTVGRSQSATIYLGEQDGSISREHAQIMHQAGAFGLKPLRENNPTYINGNAVEYGDGEPLSDGDEIGLGDNSKFRFRTV